MRVVRISHFISCHVFASIGSMGLGLAPPCVAVMCVALRRDMRLSVTLLCDALYCWAGCMSHCRTVMCAVLFRCAPLSGPSVCVCVCVLQCSMLLHPGLFVVLHCSSKGRPVWPQCA